MCCRPKILVGLVGLALLMGASLPVYAEEAHGTIVLVRPDKNELVLTETFRDLTFHFDNRSKVYINNREAQLSELQVGDEATVRFERIGERLIVDMVHSLRYSLSPLRKVR